MTDLHALLARSDSHGGEVIFAVIVFIVWGIGALVNMSKKQSEQAKRRQAQLDAAVRAQVGTARQRETAARQMPRSPGQRRQVSAPLPSALRGKAVRPVQQVSRPQPPRGKQQRQPQKRRVQRTPPALPLTQPVMEEIPRVVESEIGAGAVPASPTRRQAIAGPVIQLSARSLRQQFILTEILQPPLALREHV